MFLLTLTSMSFISSRTNSLCCFGFIDCIFGSYHYPMGLSFYPYHYQKLPGTFSSPKRHDHFIVDLHRLFWKYEIRDLPILQNLCCYSIYASSISHGEATCHTSICIFCYKIKHFSACQTLKTWCSICKGVDEHQMHHCLSPMGNEHPPLIHHTFSNRILNG